MIRQLPSRSYSLLFDSHRRRDRSDHSASSAALPARARPAPSEASDTNRTAPIANAAVPAKPTMLGHKLPTLLACSGSPGGNSSSITWRTVLRTGTRTAPSIRKPHTIVNLNAGMIGRSKSRVITTNAATRVSASPPSSAAALATRCLNLTARVPIPSFDLLEPAQQRSGTHDPQGVRLVSECRRLPRN